VVRDLARDQMAEFTFSELPAVRLLRYGVEMARTGDVDDLSHPMTNHIRYKSVDREFEFGSV